jgi:predicted O-methyltransferase YrrM
VKKPPKILIAGGLVLGALLTYIARQREHPSACPYSLRFLLDFPHPSVTRSRLRELLSPQPGERVLEIGPGTGYYSLHAVRWLEPEGTLEVLDIQQQMLDHTMRRAYTLGISTSFQRDAMRRHYPTRTIVSTLLTWSPR